MEETRADPLVKAGKSPFPRLCSISAIVKSAFSRKRNLVDIFSLMLSVVASEHVIQLRFRVSQGSAEPEGIWMVQRMQTCGGVTLVLLLLCQQRREFTFKVFSKGLQPCLFFLFFSCDFIKSVGQKLTAEV